MSIRGVFSWLGNNVMDEVIDTTVRAGITTLVNGDSFRDNFKDQAILTAADAAYGAWNGRKAPAAAAAAGTTPPISTRQPPAAQNAALMAPQTTNPFANKPIQPGYGYKGTPGFNAGTGNTAIGGIGSLVNQNNQNATSVVTPPAPTPDSRGFFESMGDVIGGDPNYSRWESAKQAFLPDSKGNPDPFRKYGPMVGVGLLGAYKAGVFDPEELEEAPNRPYSQGKQNVFNRPNMYRPGVPRVSGRAQGGHVNGPGTGTSDDIPAYLSDGEFVMTNAAVAGAGGGDRQKGMNTMYNIMHDFERRA